MAATSLIGARVTPDVKDAFLALAQQQGLSASALLKQLLNVVVGQAGCAGRGWPQGERRMPCRVTRVSARLRADDHRQLCDRAAARSMRPATYVSFLVRAHLRAQAPLPEKEVAALARVVSELSAVGRNLNQIARAANAGTRSGELSRDELRAILKACEGLRDHVRELLASNLKAWEIGCD
jgi:hypothetical protein